MAKPPSYSTKQIDEILSAKGPDERVRAFDRVVAATPAAFAVPPGGIPGELLLELAGEVGSRGHRASYDSGAPSGFLAFSGMVDILPFLPESERGLAVLAAVEGAVREGLEPRPNFAGWPWSHDLGHDATMDDMDASHGAQALPKFHGRLVPFLNEETRRKYGHRYLYNRSALDHANLGHRHILAGRALRMAEALKWRDSERTLHGLSHYFLFAPTDYAAAELLQEWLEALGKDIPGDNRSRKPALPAAEALGLEEGIAGDVPRALIDRVVEVWKKGYSLEAIADALLLVPERRLRAEGASERALKALLFVDSSIAAFPWLRGHDGVLQVILSALFLQSTLGGEGATTSAAGEAALVEVDPAALALRIVRSAAHGESGSRAGEAPAVRPLLWAAAAVLLAQGRRSVSEQKTEHARTLEALVAGLGASPLAEAWTRVHPATDGPARP